MHAVARPLELRLLLPLVILVPLGFVVTHIAQTGTLDPGPLGVAVGYVGLMLGAHLALRLLGNQGDQLLLPCVATIGAIGIVMLNRLPQDLLGTDAFGVQFGMATTQLLWFAIGLTAMVLLAGRFRDDGVLRHYKYTWALAGTLLLVITFLFGREVNGARLWIFLGPVGFQPGEAIKIVLVIFIAGYLAEKRTLLAGASARFGPIRIPPLPYLLPMIAIFVIVMLVVVVSRDLGTALLFMGIFLTMLFVATGRRSYVLLGILLFIAGSFVAYNLFGHVRVRVDNWIDPFVDPSGRGYQSVQALYAFGRGGLFGEGLGQGLPTISGHLPIPALPTDFIFAAVAEELGLIGAFALLALVMCLVFRGLRTAMLARDDFSAMLAVGLTVSLGLQTLIIAAGNVKLVPLTGITFPFVSYGGSSLLACFVVVGLLLAISHRSVIDAQIEGARSVIATNVRRLAVYLVLAFASVSGALVWWQVLDAQTLATRQDNPQVIATRRSLPRGSIFDAQGRLLASSVVTDGISRRTYTDPAFTHLIGYASLRFGATGVERAWDDLLTGRTDPNPLRDVLNDILDRQPDPHDLTLTIDQRLQDFAAAQLGTNRGAVVAIDPQTGAILAMVSTPSYDATGFSGDPSTAQAPFDAVAATPDNPFLDRTRQGHYTPGSIMKVLTAAAALDTGAITPQTTFPDQPREEVDGFVVSGFTIREHDLGNVVPALWDLSPALQVSSNIYFAHVGLELGADRYLDYAHRFGFCEGLRIGSDGRGLPVDPSFVSTQADGGCAPFRDDVELASAAFGQAAVSVTPLQMALLAATIANDGAVPQPFLVRDLRSHAATPAGGPTSDILDTYAGGRGDPVISSQVAAQVRQAMIDAVSGPIGRLYAGAGDVNRFGISGVQTAGKTGTAERGPGLKPHSWFIGFAPAQAGGSPTIAIAVIVEGGETGSGHAAPIGGAIMAEWLRLIGV